MAAMRRTKYKAVKFLRRPFRVTCLACGFLACEDAEVDDGTRVLLGTSGQSARMPSQAYLDALGCRRSQWIDHDLFGTPLFDVVNERQRCKAFLRYKPGFSPEEHMKRLSDSEQRRTQFAYTILAAFLGAVLVLAGQTGQQWLTKVLGLSAPPSSATPYTTRKN